MDSPDNHQNDTYATLLEREKTVLMPTVSPLPIGRLAAHECFLRGDYEFSLEKLTIKDGEPITFPPTLINYKPEFKTLVPPLHFGIDEVHWMHPTRKSFHQLILDTELDLSSDDDVHRSEACQIFNQSIDDPLPFALRQTLLSEIENQPEIVNYFGLTPTNLPGLVSNNPNVAIAILLIMMEQREITDLLDVLVDMELSINTMEVVNRLANNLVPGSQAAELPRPFLHLYISNCICQCEKISDRYMQNRQVRLVCVFLQSLLRNRVIELQLIPQALVFEIQAFCIEFSRIREATALYSHLKELETVENSLTAAITKALDEMQENQEKADEGNPSSITKGDTGTSKIVISHRADGAEMKDIIEN